MEFTYQAYRNLIRQLRTNGYQFTDYHDYQSYNKAVIMRHDIDISLEKAVEMAEIEKDERIISTYFILLSTDFYNAASEKSLKAIKRIADCGHQIGLHFDEVKYAEIECMRTLVDAIKQEAEILSEITGFPISSVSMHRPSKETLNADYEIEGIINSYGKVFFKDFKYVSDSRRCWWENVEEIIESDKFERLHILTHPFWYHAKEKTIQESIGDFINAAATERYENLKMNITDLDGILN